jgi:hypothetical protein
MRGQGSARWTVTSESQLHASNASRDTWHEGGSKILSIKAAAGKLRAMNAKR